MFKHSTTQNDARQRVLYPLKFGEIRFRYSREKSVAVVKVGTNHTASDSLGNFIRQRLLNMPQSPDVVIACSASIVHVLVEWQLPVEIVTPRLRVLDTGWMIAFDTTTEVTSSTLSCVECYHSSACIEHSKPWSHSRPEAASRPKREQYSQIMLSPHPGSGISGSRCLIKLPRLSLAVWLVPALTTATLFPLEYRNRISPNFNGYRTRWRTSFCVVESLNTLHQLWRSFPGYHFNIV